MLKYGLIALSLACVAAGGVSSPADSRIESARNEVKGNPKDANSFNQLAFALIRKGRDLQEESLYVEAQRAIDQALRLSPGNFDAEKLRVAALLGLNEPAEALALGTQLNHKVPDDIGGWALLVDANAAMGNYAEAERDAQWVLDLRPGSSLGFEKAAALRVLFGDAEGAIEFLDETNRRTSGNDADQKAWLLTQKAGLLLASGDAEGAAKVLAEAQRLFPGSQLAAAELAKVRAAQGNTAEALRLLEARYRSVPSAANLYDWAEALAVSGQTQAADLQFSAFEKQARSDKSATLQFISYYLDRKMQPAEALTLAAHEAGERHDVATLAVYAWALYRNGKFAEAKAQMDKALAVGVRDPVYFCHAEAISVSLKDRASAGRYAKDLSSMPRNGCAVDLTLASANGVAR
jgi:tetratricopeptide (TPR) repeat protein